MLCFPKDPGRGREHADSLTTQITQVSSAHSLQAKTSHVAYLHSRRPRKGVTLHISQNRRDEGIGKEYLGLLSANLEVTWMVK